MSHKFLVSEMKMNGQESVNGQNNETKERGLREKA